VNCQLKGRATEAVEAAVTYCITASASKFHVLEADFEVVESTSVSAAISAT